MFDVAPSELMLVAVIALVVIGPKDLPRAMRFVGQWVGKARRMAGHFRSGIDTMMRESELAEMEQKWREHNEAIMRAYPTFDPMTPPSLPPPSPEAAVVSPAKPAAEPVVAPDVASRSDPA
jgi:sec-independent protein translocase protein TatB